jgi:polysaccharide export outer membrane protein
VNEVFVKAVLGCLILIGFLALAYVAPAQSPESTTEASSLIHPGDEIDVDIVGSLDYDWRGPITPEGFLGGPDALPDRVFALCRTEDEVAKDIARGLTFLRDPKVIVRIVDRAKRAPVTVFGAIRQPQRVRLGRTVRLNELLITAGGLTDRASGDIELFRPAGRSCGTPPEAAKPDDSLGRRRIAAVRDEVGSYYLNIRISELLAGESASNPVILPGDVVTILEARPIYVIGGVASPRRIATRAAMTLSRAISTSGGVAKNGDPERITIYRRSRSATATIEVNLERVRAGLEPDPALEAFDIVEVGLRGGSRRERAPVINVDDDAAVDAAQLPLRTID